MSRKCICHVETGLCVNIIDDPFDDFVPPINFFVPPDNTGEIFWYWDGDNWYNPTNQYLNAYLGQFPSADTPDTTDESNRLATTFYVKEKIQDFIYNIWTQDGILDGGSFGDASPLTLLNAGIFNDTNYNLETDYISPVFNNTGGNLTSDITASTY